MHRNRRCAGGKQLVRTAIVRRVWTRIDSASVYIASAECFASTTAHSASAVRFPAISDRRLANWWDSDHWRREQHCAVAADGSDLRRIEWRSVEEKSHPNLRLGRFFLECQHVHEHDAQSERKFPAHLRF